MTQPMYPQQPYTQTPQPQQYAPPAYPQPPQQYAPPAPQQYAPPVGGFPQDPYASQPQQAQQQYAPPMQAQPAATPVSTQSFFSGGSPYLTWDVAKGYVLGSWYGGMVIGKEQRPQTDMDSGAVRMSKFRPTEPMMEIVLTLQTSMRTDPQDDGKRSLPVKSGLVKASREALQSAGDNDIQIGSWYYAAKLGQEQVPNQAGTGTVRRNIFRALYASPGSPDPAPQPAAQSIQPQPQAPVMPQQYAQPPVPQGYPAQPQQYAQPPQPQGYPAQPMAQAGAPQFDQGFAPQQPPAPRQLPPWTPVHQPDGQFGAPQQAQQPQQQYAPPVHQPDGQFGASPMAQQPQQPPVPGQLPPWTPFAPS